MSVRDVIRMGVGTFTVVPVPPPVVVDAGTASKAVLAAPLWGAAIAIPAGTAGALLAWWGAGSQVPSIVALLAGAVVLGVMAWLSRGFHLDGLVDTADGFASMRSGAEGLAVMRDPRVGALGVVTLVLALGLQAASLAMLFAQLAPAAAAAAFAAVAVAARSPLGWIARVGTPHDPDGLGSTVIGAVPIRAAVVCGALGSAVAAIALSLTGIPVVFALGAAAAPWLVGALLRRGAHRRFGAVTGDVLGAGVEWATTASLVVLAVGLMR